MEQTCENCKNMGYMSPCHDQPYPEFWCKLGEWDGLSSMDDIYKEIDCEHFEEKK